MKRADTANRGPSRGFTLIEILVVISIIGVLAGLVGVIIAKANQKAERTGTIQVVSTVLATKCRMFKQEFGNFPRSSVSSMKKSLPKTKPYKNVGFVDGNDVNVCNEILMVQLRHPDFSKKLQDDEMGMIQDPIGNTDEDSFTDTPHGARDTEAREVHDSWGHPIVYIYNADYEKVFMIMNLKGETVEVQALKSPDGTYYNPNKFQIIALGEDGEQALDGDPQLWDDFHNFKPRAAE